VSVNGAGVPRRSRSTRTPPIEDKWIKSGGRIPDPDDEHVFIGIDLSLRATGLVAISGENHGRYYWRLHKPPPSLGGPARLAAHRWMLEDWYATVGTPQWQCLENYGFGSTHRGMEIGEWGGVARLSLYDHGLADITSLVAPNTLKKFVTNNGKAPKNLVLRGVYKVWGIEAIDDNIADAYALAQAAITRHTGEARYAWQRDALRRLGPLHGAPDEP
jgi:Holliday junction resolvasome RuvABC endonuclease subunit